VFGRGTGVRHLHCAAWKRHQAGVLISYCPDRCVWRDHLDCGDFGLVFAGLFDVEWVIRVLMRVDWCWRYDRPAMHVQSWMLNDPPSGWGRNVQRRQELWDNLCIRGNWSDIPNAALPGDNH
jgi:hypothetical protein